MKFSDIKTLIQFSDVWRCWNNRLERMREVCYDELKPVEYQEKAFRIFAKMQKRLDDILDIYTPEK